MRRRFKNPFFIPRIKLPTPKFPTFTLPTFTFLTAIRASCRSFMFTLLLAPRKTVGKNKEHIDIFKSYPNEYSEVTNRSIQTIN